MIEHIDITDTQRTLQEDAKAYIHKKIGRLDKYVPKTMRTSIKTAVHIEDQATKNPQNPTTCSVYIALSGGKEFKATDSGRTLEAAVDKAEAKMRKQLQRYHDEATDRSPAMRMASRLKRALGR